MHDWFLRSLLLRVTNWLQRGVKGWTEGIDIVWEEGIQINKGCDTTPTAFSNAGLLPLRLLLSPDCISWCYIKIPDYFFPPSRLGLLSGQTANKWVSDHFQSLGSSSASSNPGPPFSSGEKPALLLLHLIYPSISPFLITVSPANLIFHQPLEPSHADSLINQTDSKAHTQDYWGSTGCAISCTHSIPKWICAPHYIMRGKKFMLSITEHM